MPGRPLGSSPTQLAQSVPDVTVVENREVRGLSGGKNTGAALAATFGPCVAASELRRAGLWSTTMMISSLGKLCARTDSTAAHVSCHHFSV